MPAMKPDGKRTIKKSLDVTPETDKKIKELRARWGITLADLVNWAAENKLYQMKYDPPDY